MNWQTPSSTTVSWSKRKILSKRHLFGVVATEQRVRITWQQTLHSVLFSAQHIVYTFPQTTQTEQPKSWDNQTSESLCPSYLDL